MGKILTSQELLDLLEVNLSRYGIDMNMLEGYSFDTHRRKYLSIFKTPDGFDTENALSVGIPLLRFRMAHPKLTTAGAMLIGHLASKNIVNLNAQEALEFLHCNLMTIEKNATQKCDPKGFVIARCAGLALGVGFYEEDHEGRWLKGLFPARWRKGEILPFSLDS